MVKRQKHWLKCIAPICIGDKTPGWEKQVVWYPGEAICKRKPYSPIQKKQIQINKVVKINNLKILSDGYTARSLIKLTNISLNTFSPKYPKDRNSKN